LICIKKNLLIYIASQSHINILNVNLELISSWPYSVTPSYDSFFRGLKIDQNLVYLSIDGCHQIFLHKSHDGTLVNRWGTVKESSKQGEFHFPLGITLNKEFIYICDRDNHRVQLLKKKDGVYSSQWGKQIQGTEMGEFSWPSCIYHDLSQNIFYVGDCYSVQLFKPDGACVQRLGGYEEGNNMNQFHWVYGICLMDDELYVSDQKNKRIQIYRRRQGSEADGEGCVIQ